MVKFQSLRFFFHEIFTGEITIGHQHFCCHLWAPGMLLCCWRGPGASGVLVDVVKIFCIPDHGFLGFYKGYRMGPPRYRSVDISVAQLWFMVDITIDHYS